MGDVGTLCIEDARRDERPAAELRNGSADSLFDPRARNWRLRFPLDAPPVGATRRIGSSQELTFAKLLAVRLGRPWLN